MAAIKAIDIHGGYPLEVVTFGGRSNAAAGIAYWAANNATAAWCLAPTHLGELEVTFARATDLDSFMKWLATGAEVHNG